MALPSSRATPLQTCPALRPRWCPERSPVTRPGRLACRRLEPVGFPPPRGLEGYPDDHDDTHFGALSRGLHPRYARLRTSLTGLHAGSLLTSWRGVRQVGREP